MFGPLFRYELTRLARRGLQPKLRAAFAGLLLVALLLAYLAAFPGVSPLQLFTEIDQPLSTEAASRFGERFAVSFLLIQTLIVVLVTPALAAAAIGEEKDRRSLDLLLTTPLTDREIVVGKLAARFVFVGMLLLTGLPVVVLTVFFGGVDPALVAGGYALALFTVCSLGSFSLWLAVESPTLGGALLRAYAVAVAVSLIGLMCGCFRAPALLSPLSALAVLIGGWPGFMSPSSPVEAAVLLAWYGVVHVGLAALFLRLAAHQLREPAVRAVPTIALDLAVPPRDDDLQPVETSQPVVAPFRLHNVPELDDADPLGWKERHFGGAGSLNREVIRLGAGVMLTLFLMLFVALRPQAAGGVAALIVLGTGVCAIIASGCRAAGCVARERQARTLESLLALPVSRREIVLAKARAAAQPGVWLGVVATLAAFLGTARGGLEGAAIIAVPVVLACWVGGAVGFGLWLSVRCATRERAVAWLLGVGLALCVLAPLLAGVLTPPAATGGVPVAAVVRGLGPVTALWNACGVRDERAGREEELEQLTGAILGAVPVGALGLLLGLLAARRFERRE